MTELELTGAADGDAVVADLHARARAVICVVPAGGVVRWTASLSGEDFLDGAWVRMSAGAAKTVKQARLKAARALLKSGGVTLRGEQEARDMHARLGMLEPNVRRGMLEPNEVVVSVEAGDVGLRWTATLTGEWHFDGPVTLTSRGVARSHRQALLRAVRAVNSARGELRLADGSRG